MGNKELIVVGSSFLLIVGIGLFMYIGQQKNSIAVTGINELKAEHDIRIEQLELQLQNLTDYVHRVDSIYHKNQP